MMMDDDRFKLAQRRGVMIEAGRKSVNKGWLTPGRAKRRETETNTLFLELLEHVEQCREGRCDSADH